MKLYHDVWTSLHVTKLGLSNSLNIFSPKSGGGSESCYFPVTCYFCWLLMYRSCILENQQRGAMPREVKRKHYGSMRKSARIHFAHSYFSISSIYSQMQGLMQKNFSSNRCELWNSYCLVSSMRYPLVAFALLSFCLDRYLVFKSCSIFLMKVAESLDIMNFFAQLLIKTNFEL